MFTTGWREMISYKIDNKEPIKIEVQIDGLPSLRACRNALVFGEMLEAPLSHPSGQSVPEQGMGIPRNWVEQTCPDPRQWSFLVLVAQGLTLI